MMRKIALAFVVLSSFLSVAAPAEAAATLHVNGSGQLTGADGVLIDSSVYDVGFIDGTCAAIFGDCTNSSNFNFSTLSAALHAAQALLDQVFVNGALGQFDSNPALTYGCSSADNCFATIPYETFNGGFYSNEAWNTPTTDYSNVSLTVTGDFDSSTYADHVYAFFTYVGPARALPEPSTWAMMLLGFAAIGLAVNSKVKTSLAIT